MSIQVFYESPAVVAFPLYAGIAVAQLRHLYFDAVAETLLGLFINDARNYGLEAGFPGSVGRGILVRIARDGTLIDWTRDPRGNAFNSWGGRFAILLASHPRVAATDDGRIVRALEPWAATLDPPAVFYELDPLFQGHLFTRPRVAALSLIDNLTVYILRVATGKAWGIQDIDSFTIAENPGLTEKYLNVTFMGQRDILYIDASRIACTFMDGDFPPSSADSDPAIIRIFDTTTTPFTLVWEDRLPSNDDVAAFDPVNRILYSTNRYGGKLHASRLERAPTTISIPTLATSGVSSLIALQATAVSVLVSDSFSAPISQATVRWTLASQVSGGQLNSAYSRTNDSGGATIFYVGPFNPPGSLTESITAEVATV